MLLMMLTCSIRLIDHWLYNSSSSVNKPGKWRKIKLVNFQLNTFKLKKKWSKYAAWWYFLYAQKFLQRFLSNLYKITQIYAKVFRFISYLYKFVNVCTNLYKKYPTRCTIAKKWQKHFHVLYFSQSINIKDQKREKAIVPRKTTFTKLSFGWKKVKSLNKSSCLGKSSSLDPMTCKTTSIMHSHTFFMNPS